MFDGQLKFRENGKFRILIFTDIHAKPENKKDRAEERKHDTLLFMNTAIKKLKPDFIILGGDNCTDFNGIEGFYPLLRWVSSPMRENNIPFATVLGNHEHDGNLPVLRQVIKAYESCPMCMTENEFDDGSLNLNQHIMIKSSDGKKDAFTVWLMDSNNVIEVDGRTVYDNVHRPQTEWYEKTAEEIKKKNGRTVPAVLFQHIPLPEIYCCLRRARWYEKYSAEKGHDIFSDYSFVKGKTCKGYLGEAPDMATYNSGQFESWKKTGDIKAAFFGHDHMNDFDGEYNGIIMGQCKTGGFFAYTDGCRTAARVVDLEESGKVSTHMVHFKELGLECSCLGPVEKRITDRQSMTLHKLKWAAAGAALLSAGAAAVYRLK